MNVRTRMARLLSLKRPAMAELAGARPSPGSTSSPRAAEKLTAGSGGIGVYTSPGMRTSGRAPPHPGSTELTEVRPLSREGRGEKDFF